MALSLVFLSTRAFVLAVALSSLLPSAVTGYTNEQGSSNKASKPSDTKVDQLRSPELVVKTLQLKGKSVFSNKERVTNEILQGLLETYETSINPLEKAYKFKEFHKDAQLASEMKAKPLVLMLGPWSTGKTTLINYLLGLDESQHKLYTGPEPTTTDFFVLHYGPKHRKLKGMDLVTDRNKAFGSLESMGLNFTERLQGVEIPHPLLDMVTLVDSPGIMENKKQQKRGYPFNDVLHWFIQRASLVFLILDPTKLEVGSELSTAFSQLKGHEGKLRIILNKADTVSQQELMRVYGALFWNLAPIIHSVEPPRIFVCTLWKNRHKTHPMYQLFVDEEVSLYLDLQQTVDNQLENKITYIRRYAYLVRLHALIVDSFLYALEEKSSSFFDNDHIEMDILNDPQKYGIHHRLLGSSGISKHDLPTMEIYTSFFTNYPISSFKHVNYYCYFLNGCHMDKLTHAISVRLPELLAVVKNNMNTKQCNKDSCN